MVIIILVRFKKNGCNILQERRFMAITLDEIEGFLNKSDFKYERDYENNHILLSIADNANSAMLFVRALEDGDFFEIEMEPLAKNNTALFDIDCNHKNISKVLMYLMQRNYVYKFGNWEYDCKRGDLRFATKLPLEDNNITYNQFGRTISIQYTALEDVENIIYVLEHGDLPTERSKEAKMTSEDELSDDDGI